MFRSKQKIKAAEANGLLARHLLQLQKGETHSWLQLKASANVQKRPSQAAAHYNKEGFRGNRTLDLLFTRQAL